MNNIKKTLKGPLHFSELVLGLTIPIAGLPLAYHGLINTIDSITDTNRNNSVFCVSNSKIYDNLFTNGKTTIQQFCPTYKQIAQIRDIKDNKDKSLFLKEQLTNCLLSCPKKDKEGNPVDIHATTHSQVVAYYKRANELGLIDNLEIEEAGSKSLTVPKILLGNFNNLSEKYDFFNIKFNRTDKTPDMDTIQSLLKTDNLNSELYNLNLDANGDLLNIDRKHSPLIKFSKLNPFKKLTSKKTLMLDEPKEIKRENKLAYLKVSSPNESKENFCLELNATQQQIENQER